MSPVFWAFGKISILLIIIGFCLPVAYGLNGFQLAHSDIASPGLSFVLYGLFISAVIGLLFYFLDNIFLEISGFVDLWAFFESKIVSLVEIIICICFGLIPFLINLKEHGGNYQYGIILIFIGFALSLIFHIISLVMEINEGVGGSGGSSSGISSNSSSSSSSSDDDYYFPDVCP